MFETSAFVFVRSGPSAATGVPVRFGQNVYLDYVRYIVETDRRVRDSFGKRKPSGDVIGIRRILVP